MLLHVSHNKHNKWSDTVEKNEADNTFLLLESYQDNTCEEKDCVL